LLDFRAFNNVTSVVLLSLFDLKSMSFVLKTHLINVWTFGWTSKLGFD